MAAIQDWRSKRGFDNLSPYKKARKDPPFGSLFQMTLGLTRTGVCDPFPYLSPAEGGSAGIEEGQ